MKSAKTELVEVMEIFLSITSTTFYLVSFSLFRIFAAENSHTLSNP